MKKQPSIQELTDLTIRWRLNHGRYLDLAEKTKSYGELMQSERQKGMATTYLECAINLESILKRTT